MPLSLPLSHSYLIFIVLLKMASSCMDKKCYPCKTTSKAQWCNDNCSKIDLTIEKKQTNKQKNTTNNNNNKRERERESGNQCNKVKCLQARKKYKELLRTKKQELRREHAARSASSISVIKNIWKKFKAMGDGKKKNTASTNIDLSTYTLCFLGKYLKVR